MPGDWSYEQTRSLVGVWSQTGSMGKNGTSIISYVRVPAEFKDQLGAI